ncbi:MAG: type I-E CRISPR-associated protein Cse1/CasA [Dialister micraerophilus]|nr:type I-E CRISPR-associated protein Cse1/CasA [Dialister micraerophilus]
MSENRISRFNLLDEPWIRVITDYKGNMKEVSLVEFFRNAHTYKNFAGDMLIQDFAVMRFLLAIIHTVFSRFDASGNEYKCIKLDENYKPLNPEEKIDEDDEDDYVEALEETWKSIWSKKQFSEIIIKYLEKWRDRFYLFDSEYPFYQVTKSDISPKKIVSLGRPNSNPTKIFGKTLNRLISESGNKIKLFSPNIEEYKDFLTEAEIARWLITYQGYIGMSDKAVFGKEKYTASKGWLYDVGGIELEGENVFETLMLNCVLIHPEEVYRIFNQKPCWEYTSKELLEKYLYEKIPDNLAELYTNWGRAIYINPEIDINAPFMFEIVKLPKFDNRNFFLEPMTIWRYNDNKVSNKEKRDTFTPRKHRENESIWRSFGLITLSYKTSNEKGKIIASHNPGIIQWIKNIHKYVNLENVFIKAISLKADSNPKSQMPTEELFDQLIISDDVLVNENWIERINDTVEFTKEVIHSNYRKFLTDVEYIRGLEEGEKGKKSKKGNKGKKGNKEIEKLYFEVDGNFKVWIQNIKVEDDFEETVKNWKEKLRKIVLLQADKIVKKARNRDYTGKEKDGKIFNIAIAYNNFKYFLNKKFSS